MSAIFSELPTKLGIYTLTELLGSREYSELYLATQSYVERAVVIEVLRPDCSAEVTEAFQASARKRAGITLPRVSPVFESVQTGSFRYLIQEQPKGKSLRKLAAEGVKLTPEQAFSLIQAVAELYGDCTDQGVAALPLASDSIYMADGAEFCFFSPVTAREIHKQQHVEQMASLADVLEETLSEKDAAKSNVSIIIHWLRNGYGGQAIEWRPLASSLHTLRAKKLSEQKGPSVFTQLKLIGKKRLLKRLARVAARCAAWVAGCLAVACIIGWQLGRYIEPEESETRLLSAQAENAIYCGTAEKSWRVQLRPVSIAEYKKFLDAWEMMTIEQQNAINEGMPESAKQHKPQQWAKLLQAIQGVGEWEGMQITMDSPVRGVSYWDAVAYARYAGGELAGASLVKTARQYAPEGLPAVEEWTSTQVESRFPYDAYYVVYPAEGEEPVQAEDLDKQDPRRGFRIAFEN